MTLSRWKHQAGAFNFAVDRPASMLAMAMGTGKSRVVCDLLEEWQAKRVLILCPVSVRNVWRREFDKWLKNEYCVAILNKGTVASQTELAQAACSCSDDLMVAVVQNYESAWRKPFGEWALTRDWDVVVLDESHRCFRSGTLVSTPSGDQAIESLTPGMKVWGRDDKTGKVVATTIKQCFTSKAAVGAFGPFECTQDHPIWTTRGYLPASNLVDSDPVGYIVPKGEPHEQENYPETVRILWQEFSRAKKNDPILQQQGGSPRPREVCGGSREVHTVHNIETETGNYFAARILVHNCKAHNTNVSRFTMKLGGRAKRRLCLTGTPMPHSPLDVFGQYRFLDSRIFGRTWMPFLHSYAIRGNPTIPQQITGFRNLNILQERFGRLAYQVTADVLDLPEAMHHTRRFTLPAAAQKVYADMEQDFIAEVEEGVITAANALVKTLRLRQVVSGFIKLDDNPLLPKVRGMPASGEIVDIHDGKARLLADLAEDVDEPIVVFAEFRRDLQTIRSVANCLGRSYGEISGDQNDLTSYATMPDDIDIMGVQYRSGGVGIDLSRARYCILYSPTYSLGDYDQALARVHRPGQKGNVQFYHLVASGTVDEVVYRALRDKRNVVESVLAALRERQIA